MNLPSKLPAAVLVLGALFAAPARADEPLSAPPLPDAHEQVSAPEAEVREGSPVARPDRSVPEATGPGLRVARVLVGTLTSAAIGYGSGLTAAVATFAIACGSGCSGWDSLGPAALAILVGTSAAMAAMPLGAYLSGRLMGSKGSYLWTMLGAGIGGAAGYAAIYLMTAANAGGFAYLPLLLFPPLGAAIANELSSARNEAQAAHPEGMAIVPVVSVGTKGAFAGLAARF
jgi:hypothetical protein